MLEMLNRFLLRIRFYLSSILILYLGVAFCVFGQSNGAHRPTPDQCHRFMFYNVQNLFDTENNAMTQDDEFLPGGNYRWSPSRLERKIKLLGKVIIDVGGWKPPALIALCEIENREILKKVIMDTPLRKYNYGILHYESADERGIDVGLIYRRDLFKVIESRAVKIVDNRGQKLDTRDILFVKGILEPADTLSLIINHWPSRYGGVTATARKRALAANMLGQLIHKVLSTEPGSNLMIAGDFNDTREDKSIQSLLDEDPLLKASISSLKGIPVNDFVEGTYKYQGIWYDFDQIWISENLRKKGRGIKVVSDGFFIHANEGLLVRDRGYIGRRPKKTYHGMKYEGGVSDHLPIYVDLCSDRN